MKIFTKLNALLIVSTILFFSCGSSHQIACPDYSIDPRFKSPAQAYNPQKYRPPKVDNKYKMDRVRSSSNQTVSAKLQEGNREVIETQTIQMPEMADVLELPEQPGIIPQSTDEANSPDIGISLNDESVSNLGENSDIDKLTLTAQNKNEKTSNVYNQSNTSTIERPEVEEADDATVAPPVAVKSRKENRQALRDFRRAAKDSINPQSDGEVKPVTGMAIAALVLGIVSLFFFPFITGTLGVVFGGIALKRANNNPNKEGRGMALAGLICGIVGLAGGLVILFLL